MVVDVPAAAVPPIVLAVIVVPYAGALTVTAPVAPETETLVPATRDVTPLFVIDRLVVCDPDTVIPVPPATTGAVIVTAPVDALTLMPVPARLVTPVLLTVIVVLPDVEIAVPATMLFTPVALTVSAVVPDPATVIPVPPVTVGAVIVTAPVLDDTLIPDPASDRTPVFVIVRSEVPVIDRPDETDTLLTLPPPPETVMFTRLFVASSATVAPETKLRIGRFATSVPALWMVADPPPPP
jgi:hypothetical protein